jgi:uncharacterized iron-regulated membrane protein
MFVLLSISLVLFLCSTLYLSLKQRGTISLVRQRDEAFADKVTMSYSGSGWSNTANQLDKAMSVGTIVGIVIGSLAGVGVLICVIMLVICLCKRKPKVKAVPFQQQQQQQQQQSAMVYPMAPYGQPYSQ